MRFLKAAVPAFLILAALVGGGTRRVSADTRLARVAETSGNDSYTAQDPDLGEVAQSGAGSQEEIFPESRFGHQPARQIDQEAYRSSNSNSVAIDVNRNPASLVDDSGGGKPTSVASSIAEVAARHGVQEVAVIAGDLGFFPKTVFVTRDIPVRLYVTGASRNTLCLMMDSFGVRKQIRTNRIEEIAFTPSVPGKYRFYCPVNGMEGNLIVKEMTSDLALAR